MYERPFVVTISLLKWCFCQAIIKLCFIIFVVWNIGSVNNLWGQTLVFHRATAHVSAITLFPPLPFVPLYICMYIYKYVYVYDEIVHHNFCFINPYSEQLVQGEKLNKSQLAPLVSIFRPFFWIFIQFFFVHIIWKRISFPNCHQKWIIMKKILFD